MLSVRLPEPLQERLAAYCARTGSTKSAVLQQAVRDFLERRGPAAPASRPARVGKSYEAFRRAGLVGAIKAAADEKETRSGAGKEAVRKQVHTRRAGR